VSAALVATAALLGASEDLARDLQYDRGLVASGEVWRLATGQLVAWTPRMAVADLGAIAALGAWLEARGRRRGLIAGLLSAGAATALGVHLLLPRLALYRGGSGLAAALLVLVAADLAAGTRDTGRRLLALAALALLAGKLLVEAATGRALAAGDLPPGVALTPLVHLLGAVAGALVALGERGSSRPPLDRR
jgi:hypothetical protein